MEALDAKEVKGLQKVRGWVVAAGLGLILFGLVTLIMGITRSIDNPLGGTDIFVAFSVPAGGQLTLGLVALLYGLSIGAYLRNSTEGKAKRMYNLQMILFGLVAFAGFAGTLAFTLNMLGLVYLGI